MKVAILQFPGSNCDWDAEHAMHDVLGIPAKRIWHKSRLPSETEAVVVPAGALSKSLGSLKKVATYKRKG